MGSNNEFHFVHHGLPHARTKRSVGHLRLLKADPQVAHAVQQTGFLRAKRGYGLPKAALSADELMVKKSPWVSLREALDGAEDGSELSPDEEFDSHVVHDEGFFNRMQYSANHRYNLIQFV